MTSIRNKSLAKQVMSRDLGICRACGLQASEAHHITPIVCDGEDSAENMVALCEACHHFAPNTKEEFIEYLDKGGAKTVLFYGIVLTICKKEKKEIKDVLPIAEEILNYMKEFVYTTGLEKYNLKGIEKIPKAKLN